MLDLIVVGNGLTANVLALELQKKQVNYTLIGNAALSRSSLVAAGIWNPIVFKRMTKSWLADDLIPYLKQFYKEAEQLTGEKFYTERAILKPFFSEEEKNFWVKKSQGDLAPYIDQNIYTAKEDHQNLIIPGYYGVVKQSGNIHLQNFLNACTRFHEQQNKIVDETFDHEQLKIESDHLIYKNIKAKSIVFCEGHLVKDNPYFHWIPLNPVKGEVLEITCHKLELGNNIFNRNGFIMPLEDHQFKIGATYEWKELNEIPTEKGKEELQQKLSQMLTSPYNIKKHDAAVRPSSIDRRPIIGPHPKHDNIFVFNGLGTKGVMIAPYFAKNFVNFYLKKEALHNEVTIERFYSKYTS